MELLSRCPEKFHCPVPLETLVRTWLETVIVTIEFRNYPAKLKLFGLKSGQNFCSGSLGVLQNLKNWLETAIVTREFQNYPVKLKLFGLKSGQNIRSGSLGVL